MAGRRKAAARAATVVAALLVLVQLVPYGWKHSNPPSTGSPDWDSPRTEQLVRRACFDCHSNETAWPWYAWIAPVSWRIRNDVEEGRSKVNFSEFDRGPGEAGEAAEVVEKGEMPPWDYSLMHPESRLSDPDRQALLQGLRATLGSETHENGEHHEDD